jgi:hypothetical protein
MLGNDMPACPPPPPLPLQLWGGVSREAQDLVAALLQHDAAARPTAQQVLAHPWLTARLDPATSAELASPLQLRSTLRWARLLHAPLALALVRPGLVLALAALRPASTCTVTRAPASKAARSPAARRSAGAGCWHRPPPPSPTTTCARREVRPWGPCSHRGSAAVGHRTPRRSLLQP